MADQPRTERQAFRSWVSSYVGIVAGTHWSQQFDERLDAVLAEAASAPSVTRLREAVEALQGWEHGYEDVVPWPGGAWVERDAVLALLAADPHAAEREQARSDDLDMELLDAAAELRRIREQARERVRLRHPDDTEAVARAIHSTGIAYCAKECNNEFGGFSGADYDMATLLIAALDRLSEPPAAITAADVRSAMEAMLAAPRSDRCPPHLIGPSQLARGIADAGEPAVLIACANGCGAMLPIRLSEPPAGSEG